MKIRTSLKSAKLREKGCRVVRRHGRVYVINKKNPRFKARQDDTDWRSTPFRPAERANKSAAGFLPRPFSHSKSRSIFHNVKNRVNWYAIPDAAPIYFDGGFQ